MKIYVVTLANHHCDDEIEVYRKSSDAIKRVNRYVKARCKNSNYKPKEMEDHPDFWLYFIDISQNGDFAHVKEVELQ